jgi:hypothetical protein
MNSSYDDALFFSFYFNTILTFFWVNIFHFFYVVVISKVHYESMIFLEFIQKNYDDYH